MNDSESNDLRSSNSGGKKSPLNRRSVGGIAVVILVAVYGFAQPKLNERYGWNLPGLKQDRGGQVVVDDSQTSPAQGRPAEGALPKSGTQTSQGSTKYSPTQNGNSTNGGASTPQVSSRKADSGKTDSAKPRGPLASRMSPTKSSPTSPSADSPRGSPSSPRTAPTAKSTDGDLLYGILRDTGSKRYVSPSGLMYTPGSAEGHRLEHLRRHTKDDTSRPVHGVFDGEMVGALQTIDLAYERAKKNQKTTKQTEDGRIIYTVDMGKRIGFVGGQSGRRKRNPMARRVKLVLSGNHVITAFPL